MKRKIHQWSLLYYIVWLYVYLSHKLFYKRIIVKGLENVPMNSPVILAPNHQNAFMDALLIACTVSGQTVFMARADVFQNKWLAKIFRFLKIMPVYRMRDGFENLDKNNALFEEAIDVLENKKKLCLMPEGTHGDKHILKPLVKGIFRIALSAAEKFPELSHVIVPIGIEYSNYSAFRSQVVIQFGKPIQVNSYSGIYKSNPPKAINLLRDQLSLEMKKLMIHIDCIDLYETVDYLRIFYRPFGIRKLGYFKKNPWHEFLADKWFTDICNLQYNMNSAQLYDLKEDVSMLHYKLDVLKLKPETLLKKLPGFFKIIFYSLLFIILFPFFLTGYLLNIGLVSFSKVFTKNIEDTQFHGSVKFTVTSLLFPFYYGLLWFVISLFIHNFLYQLLFLTGIAITGEFAYLYYVKLKGFVQVIKMKIYRAEINIIFPLWKSLINKTDNLCNCPPSNI